MDISSPRKSHRNGVLRNTAWASGTQSVTDGLTRGTISKQNQLWQLMITKTLCIDPEGWLGNSANVWLSSQIRNSLSVDIMPFD